MRAQITCLMQGNLGISIISDLATSKCRTAVGSKCYDCALHVQINIHEVIMMGFICPIERKQLNY